MSISSNIIELIILNSNSSPIQGTNFNVDLKLIRNNNRHFIQFPQFSFTISGIEATLQSTNILSECFIPSKCHSQKFLLSTNNAFLSQFTYETLPTQLPLVAYELFIDKSRRLHITGKDNNVLPIGAHTINSQIVCIDHITDEIGNIQSHIFQMQLMDSDYYILPNYVTPIDATYNDLGCNLMKLHLPAFTFTTVDDISDQNQVGEAISVSGGYVISTTPLSVKPAQDQTVVEIINTNGIELGLNITIDTYGNLLVMASNMFGATIPTGTYTTCAIDIYFHNYPDVQAEKSRLIGPGFTDITQFTGSSLSDGIRDFHINDAHKNVKAWTWCSNSDISDKTNNALDVFVVIEDNDSKENICFPTNLTHVNPQNQSYSTSVAINKQNTKNIVVGWSNIDWSNPAARNVTFLASVTDDKGKQWSKPFQVTTLAGSGRLDCRGVIADKYGNFIYSIVWQDVTGNKQVYFYASAMEGKKNSWKLIYQSTDVPVYYDYCSISLGTLEGKYGLWFAVDKFTTRFSSDGIVTLGFVHIRGLGDFGKSQKILLPYPDVPLECDITATIDGHVLMYTPESFAILGYNYYADIITIKKPGPLIPEKINFSTTVLNTGQNILPTNSYPAGFDSYFPVSQRSSRYDEKRKVLYTLITEQPNALSQDMYLFLIMSFDLGRTWSPRIPVSDSNINNRGFPSLAYDSESGDLVFGWYDARNDPNSNRTQYFAVCWSKKKIDQLLKEISNFSIP